MNAQRAKNTESQRSIIDYGKAVLSHEADAVSALSQSLGESFELSVKLILGLTPQSHLVVSGMGKAGFVAMKISASFASTGIPSFFLHPAEAIHGDLGRCTKNDVSLILSNSGETPEVLRMLPNLKRIGCPIISITSDPNSTLAKHSDVTLNIGKVDEAGPLGLAPTTSTTVMLALGDALTMAVMNEREFTPEEYAFYHPGGALGRSLLLVKEVMRSGEEHCVVSDKTIGKEVLHQITLTKGRPGAASIVDQSGRLVGIFTDGDLRRCLEREPAFLNHPISEVMGRSPKTISPEKLAQEALRLMSEYKIDQLVVVDSSFKPIGMLDIQDLISIRS